jgi:hypothetical protein
MNRGDIHTISTWLSPDYVTRCAKEHGIKIASELYPIEELIEDNDWIAVLGAEEAYKEIRGLIRNYVTFVKKRDKVSIHELDLAQSLRAMGYVGNFQRVIPIPQTEWRKTAIFVWSKTGSIPGVVEIDLPSNEVFSLTEIKYATLKTISRAMVVLPHLNRCLLKGRVWQRMSGHILLPTELDSDEIVTLLLDPSRMTNKQIKSSLFRGLRRAVKAHNHELTPISYQLLREWYRSGFVASPAAAMVSFSPNIDLGWSALSNNGIPVTVSVGRKKNKVTFACNINHQIWDGSMAGSFYQYLKDNFVKTLFEK